MRKQLFFCLSILFSQFVFSQQDIFEVARNGTVAMMENLVKENPALINAVNNEGYGLLVLATYRGNNAVAEFLLKKGANVNGTSNYGSPLMAAVVKGNTAMVQLLLKHGADTNTADSSGNTALIYAVIFKKYEIAEMLVKANTNITLKDIRGNSALDYAKMTKDEKLIQLLKK